MASGAAIPLETCPHVVHAWRSVHRGPRTESFVIEGLWGVHLYRYSAEVRMDGVPFAIEPGCAGFTPPGARMAYDFRGTCVHVFAHLAWPKEAGPCTPLPMMFPTGSRFEALWARLEESIAWRGSRRADVRAWDVLLELADLANASAPETHGAVAAALGFIEAHLAEGISASDVAKAACVSHNHLCRLFHQQVGETPMEAIRRRRVERARHLLIHTTLPIKEIAVQVGIDDLQKFNKTVRLETGRSPRELRRTGAIV